MPNTTDSAPAVSMDIHPIFAQLHKGIRHPAPSLFYRLGMLLVAMVMVILPLLYIAMIAGLGYLLYLHAQYSRAILSVRYMQGKIGFLVYFGPLIIGTLAILFMIKPLFAPRGKAPTYHRLDPKNHPLLFDLVSRLCRCIRCPIPREIFISCEVNAAAFQRSGLLSLVRRDMRLLIGLPLVDGLDLRQFTGVLAHEFGHFSQGAGMRLYQLIEQINHWFARVALERDAWDEQLHEEMQKGQGGVQLVLALAGLLIILTRKILYLLMIVGRTVSLFLSRQMEYDADCCAARVVGAEAYASALARLPLLSVAGEKALTEVVIGWRSRQLCDDIPGLILANVDTIPADIREKIEQVVHQAKTRWWHSHPAIPDRIAQVMRDAAPGILQTDLPAAVLLSDRTALAKSLTLALYKQNIGAAVPQECLMPLESFLRSKETQPQ